MSKKVLISSCLLGEAVRFDGKSKYCHHPFIELLKLQGLLVSTCPELAGGLSIPRAPAEIVQSKVINVHNVDVTQAFALGANKTLELANNNQIKMAILKANSPSCGNQQVYDGSFQKQLINGLGITAKALFEHGIKVFNESQLGEAEKYYQFINNL